MSRVSDSLFRLVHTKCELSPLTRCVVAAGEVADARPLDLDHAGPEVGELAAGVRRGDRLLQRHHREATKGLHEELL